MEKWKRKRSRVFCLLWKGVEWKQDGGKKQDDVSGLRSCDVLACATPEGMSGSVFLPQLGLY